MKEIRIVGDSSSSGVGLGTSCYPFQLATSPGLLAGGDVRVINYSVPGLTSADAARLCTSSSFEGRFDHLIIYLGNNEATCTTRKGVPGGWRDLLNHLRVRRHKQWKAPNFRSEAFAFQNVLPHVRPNSPREFEKNLSILIQSARKAGASVVLINPVANKSFPSGLHATNGLFFTHLGLSDAAPLLKGTDHDSRELVRAIRLQAEARSDAADAIYVELSASANKLVGFIARHNRAAALRDPAASIKALRTLQDEYDYYESIVLHNLSRLYLQVGDEASSTRCLGQSYECDRSTYRVTPPYRDVVDSLQNEDENVRVLDLAQLLGSQHLVDYCHPTEAGHHEIACALATLLCHSEGGDGTNHVRCTPHGETNRYENRLISPNRFFGEDDLVNYYEIDRELPRAEVLGELGRLINPGAARGSGSTDVLQRFLIHFLNSNDHHAVFNRELDLLGKQAPHSHEILNFPEYYLYRLLYNYCSIFEQEDLAARVEAEEACARLLFRSSDYRKLILRHNAQPLEMELNLSGAYLTSIELKLVASLGGAAFKNTITARIKTIRAWYTREAFRYGTQSRLSMLYDRWAIEQMAEALAVAAVVAAIAGERDRLRHYGALFRVLAELDALHEEHAAIYLGGQGQFPQVDYERSLQALEDRVSKLLPAHPV